MNDTMPPEKIRKITAINFPMIRPPSNDEIGYPSERRPAW